MPLFVVSHRRWLLLIWLLPVLGVGWTVAQAPAWREPRSLTVALEPGQSVVLGREALAALQADSEHLRVSRDQDGNWRLANLSPGKQVVWQPDGGWNDRSTREWPLTPGAAFVIGTQLFEVLIVKPDRLVMQSAGRRWEYDGFSLRLEERQLPECYENWRTVFRERLGGWPGLRRWLQRPLRLGGGVYCADRLGLAGAPVDTAMLASDRVGFVLRPGLAAGRPDSPPVIIAAGTPEAEALWLRSIPLVVGDGLIIGRTRYRVAQTAPTLKLTVLTRAWRWLDGAEPPATSSAISVQWRTVTWWRPLNVAGLAWPLGLGLAALALGWVGLRGGWRITVALALAGVSLGLHLSSLVTPMLWSYGLAWSILGLWLITVRSRWSARLLAALTLLLGIGLVAGLQLAVGAGESGWSRYGGSSAALAGAFGWLAWAGWNYGQQQRSGWPKLCRVRGGLRLLGGAAMGLLIMQVMWGDEGGWGGFQPFELIKLALVTTAAYGLASRRHRWESSGSFGKLLQGWRYLRPVVLLAMVSGFALAFLRDFSPLLLLAFWIIALIWSWARVHPQPAWRGLGRLTALALVLSAIAGLAWLREQPENFPLDFQADRIRVWAGPEQYPHAGYQLRRALEAIRAGGWQGTVWNEPINGRIMTLPAVENDFMPAFLLNRYGGLAALILVGIQAAFIGLLLTIGDRAAYRAGCNDDPLTAPGGFIYFTLYGGAALLVAHFMVSWGANLGFLPVMGQPMSLLSTAGSHLTLFVLPIVALAVAVEEKEDDNPS